MYHFRDEEILLCEAFANAVDVFVKDDIKNPKIVITFDKTGYNEGYINFHNNGTPMTKKEFDKYHVIAGSYKEKGGGIGFAGVGAKVFLVSSLGGEIITVTGENNSNFMASKMFKTENDVKYEIFENLPVLFGKIKYNHQYGTTYRVRLNQQGYVYFKEKLVNIIQFWWNYALLDNQFTVIVDGKKVKPFDHPKRFKKSFTFKRTRINCYCWISQTVIPENKRDIVYSVFGKRIMNELISHPVAITEDYANKVFCLVDVSHLAKHIKTDKESFAGNWEVNRTKNDTQKFFVDFLSEQGLVGQDIFKPSSIEIANELTKDLDKLLKTKEFKDLNPFLSARNRLVPVAKPDGDISVTKVDGEKSSGASKKNGGTYSPDGGKNADGDDDSGKSFVEDDDEGRPGTRRNKQSKGIRIIPTEEFPNEKEEAWVDLQQGAVCVNIAHPFYVKMKSADRLGILEKFNINRILIEALIKFKNDELKEEWDPQKTLDTYRNLLHKTWN